MVLCTLFYAEVVTLLWRKSLKVAFVGYVENGMYVVDFTQAPTKTATCLMAKVYVG